MGLFGFGKNTNSDRNQNNQKSTLEKAYDYFSDEQIRCESSSDQDAIEYIYKQLKYAERSTYFENNMTDAMELLDKHVYKLCESIIYQNFMLMRKVDQLSDRIDELEEYLSIKFGDQAIIEYDPAPDDGFDE